MKTHLTALTLCLGISVINPVSANDSADSNEVNDILSEYEYLFVENRQSSWQGQFEISNGGVEDSEEWLYGLQLSNLYLFNKNLALDLWAYDLGDSAYAVGLALMGELHRKDTSKSTHQWDWLLSVDRTQQTDTLNFDILSIVDFEEITTRYTAGMQYNLYLQNQQFQIGIEVSQETFDRDGRIETNNGAIQVSQNRGLITPAQAAFFRALDNRSAQDSQDLVLPALIFQWQYQSTFTHLASWARWRVNSSDFDNNTNFEQAVNESLDSNFSILELTLSGDRLLYKSAEWLVSGSLELNGFTSFDERLLSAYQVLLGGSGSIRGYEDGLVSGDEAIWTRFEVAISPQSSLNGRSQEFTTPKTRLFWFCDWGYINQAAALADDLPAQSWHLSSTGLGAQWQTLAALQLNLTLGYTLQAIEGFAAADQTRIHAQLLWSF